MPPMHWFWLAALVFFAIVEASTASLVSVWFIGGALVAMIAALLGGSMWLQFILFLAVSAILLFSLRPLAKKYLKPKHTATNAGSNIGKTAVVTEQIDNLRGKGAVKVSGVEWSARSASGEIIALDAVVRITAIEGVKLCVEQIKEEK